MATSHSCIKCLKRTCQIAFTVSAVWNSASCTWNKQFPRGALWKKCYEKLFKLHRKHKKQSSGGVLSKDVLKNFAKFTELWVSFLTKLKTGNLKLSEADVL